MVKMSEIILKSKLEPEKLLFVFHGYGADGDNLLPLGKEFSRAMPSADIYIPDGLEACNAGFGYQWFPLKGNDFRTWEKSFEEYSSRIISYVEAKMQEKHIDYKNVIFTGFSQGAMLSLGIGLKYGAQAVIAFSGLLLSSKPVIFSKHTKVLLAHGAQDDVVDISAMKMTENTLKNAGVDVQTVVSANTGHGIDNQMLDRAVYFLKSL